MPQVQSGDDRSSFYIKCPLFKLENKPCSSRKRQYRLEGILHLSCSTVSSESSSASEESITGSSKSHSRSIMPRGTARRANAQSADTLPKALFNHENDPSLRESNHTRPHDAATNSECIRRIVGTDLVFLVEGEKFLPLADMTQKQLRYILPRRRYIPAKPDVALPRQ